MADKRDIVLRQLPAISAGSTDIVLRELSVVPADIVLRAVSVAPTLYSSRADIVLLALPAIEPISVPIWLYETDATPSNIILRDPTAEPPDPGGFPTQYSGLRVYYGGAVRELCLVAAADANTGMGGAPMVRKGGVTYAVYLVETSDPDASLVRMRTSAGTKAIRLKT